MLQLLIFLALQGFSLAAPSLTPVSEPKPYFDWDSTKYLIAFGDSYTYVQGTLGYPGYSFIGSYLQDQYAITPEELLSDQIVQNFTGTAEGGPNWVEFLTGCGHRPGLTSPQDCKVQLWDFAFAGADVAEEYTPLHHNFTTPLINQTQQFLTYVQPYFESQKIHQQSQALVAIWIGINDISDSSKYNVSFPDFYNDIISTLFEKSVEPLYRAGYHNFLFLNLPPLDRTPSNIGNAHPLPNKTMVDWWDNTLSRHSTAFSAVHANVKSMVFDANTFLNGVLDNPAHYGITNTTSFCPGYTDPIIITDPGKYGCSSIDQYFWFNPGHMTSHTHSLLAPKIEQFLKEERTL